MPLLDRHGLVERRSSRSRRRAQGTALSFGQRPNELWCTDYKGEFLLGNRQYCYPLTVTDHASRFLLTCEALSSTREDYAFTVFERLFQERGLPANIRSDNGSLLHHPMLCSTSANLPSGGFASALPLSASSLAILNRMAATNACISP
jgi:transposase InsO family protein